MIDTMKLSIVMLMLCLAGISNTYADVTFDYSLGGNCFPFGDCPQNNTLEYQQFYSHYMFGTSPLEITGISFKPTQELFGGFDPTTLDFTLTLSTTLARAGDIPGEVITKGIAYSFTENLGVNTVVVFSGPITLSSSGDNVFDINIPFETPYIYDPQAGNLVLGVTDIDGGISLRGFAAGQSQVMSRYYNGTLGGAPNTFIQYGYGLATQFISDVTPVSEPFPEVPDPPPATVPEPGSLAMFLSGLVFLMLTKRRYTRS